MSIYSTMEITREDCLNELSDQFSNSTTEEILKCFENINSDRLTKVILHGINILSDEELEMVAFYAFGEKQRYNFSIVKDYSSSWHIKYKR